jgi:acetate---CoA ligase (ADP-forming)
MTVRRSGSPLTTTGPGRADGGAGLAVFRVPASVAVVGASANPAKWGYWLARGALAGRDQRAVYLVNRRGGEILGAPAAPALSDLGDVPELVAFCVPPGQVRAVVDEALALGVRGLLGITAGVPGAGELAARVSAGRARLIGPASLGLFDAATGLHLAWGSFAPGALAIVSQSGQVGSEIALLAERASLGVSRFVSVGSQLDVTAAELLFDLAGHELTRAVAVYLESFTDGRQILDAARALRAAGKPVVLLTAGGSEAGQRAARSHTGALTSPLELVDAACRAAGVLRAQTPAELVHVMAYLLTAKPPAGARVAIVSDSGGQGALAADCASRRGLAVPELTAAAQALAVRLPRGAATANPVDLAGAGEHDLGSYRDVAAALLASGEVDSVLMSGYFGRYGQDIPALAGPERDVAEQLGALVRQTGRPLVVHSMGAETTTAAVLRDAGIPVYDTVEAAAGALSGAVALSARPGRPDRASRPARPLTAGVPAGPLTQAGYWAARTLLRQAGVAFPPARLVGGPREAAAAAARLTAPYVLKAAWLEHKSEQGGVIAGLTDAAAVARAFDRMRQRLGDGPYVLEEQDVRRDVVEMIIGARRETGLGPMVTVGVGGTEAELYRDAVTECAPVDLGQALAMLTGLRCAPLLAGWRGRPPADVRSLARAVVAISELATRLPENAAEVEVNPIRVGADGAIAVDALLVPAGWSRP